jgi:hypothetical protein
MDFDDLDAKLRRMYRNLGETYDLDIGSNIKDERHLLPNGMFEHRVSFGNSDPEIRADTVATAIHAIAGIKDILKNKLREIGLNPQSYEDLINSSTELQIITDLDNMEKHGTRLSKRRYTEAVRLINLDQSLRGKGITSVTFSTDLATGTTKLDESSGDVKIVITGDIVDDKGKTIYTLEEVLEKSVKSIDAFIVDTGLAK